MMRRRGTEGMPREAYPLCHIRTKPQVKPIRLAPATLIAGKLRTGGG